MTRLKDNHLLVLVCIRLIASIVPLNLLCGFLMEILNFPDSSVLCFSSSAQGDLSLGVRGSTSYTTIREDRLVVLGGALLDRSSTWANRRPHALGCDLLNTLKSSPKVLLVTSIWLLVWGWKVVLSLSFVPNFFAQKLGVSVSHNGPRTSMKAPTFL